MNEIYSRHLVTNASTGLMAIKDLATYYDVPINIHFDKHWIHVYVGFGTPTMEKASWRTQDCYEQFGRVDYIYETILKMIEKITKFKEKK